MKGQRQKRTRFYRKQNYCSAQVIARAESADHIMHMGYLPCAKQQRGAFLYERAVLNDRTGFAKHLCAMEVSLHGRKHRLVQLGAESVRDCAR